MLATVRPLQTSVLTGSFFSPQPATRSASARVRTSMPGSSESGGILAAGPPGVKETWDLPVEERAPTMRLHVLRAPGARRALSPGAAVGELRAHRREHI